MVLLSGKNKGTAPNLVTGCTGFWEAYDATTLYTDAGTTPVSADGDAVYQMNDKMSDHHFVQATAANRPLYKVNRQNGKTGLLFDGTNDAMAGPALSHLFAAGAKTLFMAIKVPAGWTNQDRIWTDLPGSYMVTRLETTGNKIRTTNYDTGYDWAAGVAFVNATAFVYSFWHSGGALYEQINNGAVAAGVASGDTGSLAGVINLIMECPSDFYAMATFNVALSDGDRMKVNRYFRYQLGLS
jgi:hypothetical protein